jgi:acetate---CoA ligase (ADP-forming)
VDILKTLDGMFQPKSIAVIGASNKEGKIGHSVMKNLVVDSKYAGPVYPINPKDKEVLGKKSIHLHSGCAW